MSVHAKVATIPGSSVDGDFLGSYLETLAMVERLHRLLLDVVKDEFERLGIIDINSVQALLLFNVGDNEVTAGELKTRGYYQGSNVSYNLKKLVECGYMHHQRCAVDRRAVRVRLTDRGAISEASSPISSSDMPRELSTARSWASCGSTTSTPACGGWSITGPTRSATSTDRRGRHECCVSAVLANFAAPGRPAAALRTGKVLKCLETRVSAAIDSRPPDKLE